MTNLSATTQTTTKTRGKTVEQNAAGKRANKAASKSGANKQTRKKASTTRIERSDTKKAVVLELLRRKEGVTLAEIAKATGWQNHSIHGFMSGMIRKKMALTIESAKKDSGERIYRVV